MALSASLPTWLPWWLPMVIFIPVAVYLVIFLFMPFSVFGVKKRLEEIESALGGLADEVRNIRADLYVLIEEKTAVPPGPPAEIRPFAPVPQNFKREQPAGQSPSQTGEALAEAENKPVREAFEAYKNLIRSGGSEGGARRPFQNQMPDRFTFSGAEAFRVPAEEADRPALQAEAEQKEPAGSLSGKSKGQQADLSKERSEPRLGLLHTEPGKR